MRIRLAAGGTGGQEWKNGRVNYDLGLWLSFVKKICSKRELRFVKCDMSGQIDYPNWTEAFVAFLKVVVPNENTLYRSKLQLVLIIGSKI